MTSDDNASKNPIESGPFSRLACALKLTLWETFEAVQM